MPQIEVTDAAFPHLLYTPENLDARDDWPLIIFLHGSGERGTDLSLVRKWGPPKYLDDGNNLEAIVVSPQCPLDIRWEALAEKVGQFIDEIIDMHPINPHKVSITGFSMGGQGTWAVAKTFPEKFAAVAPVGGRTPDEGYFSRDVHVIKDKPLWIFHGEQDEKVDVKYSDQILVFLKGYSASNLQYTRYTQGNHGDTSDYTYTNTELYDWLLEHELDT